jgi:hypothetical protein
MAGPQGAEHDARKRRGTTTTVVDEERQAPSETGPVRTVAAPAGASTEAAAPPASGASSPAAPGAPKAALLGRGRMTVLRFAAIIRSSDDAEVEQAVLALSRSRRWLAPLALVVGAFIMLLQGLKLLVTNWRLTLVQVIPAMWIWLAMLDIKIHLLHGREFNVIRGPILIPLALGVTAVTAASFYLNGVFAFAISGPRQEAIKIRPAFGLANRHLKTILAWGVSIGLALSFSVLITTRWGKLPFALSQGIVVGIMMLCYLAVPARIVGVNTPKERSRRDNLSATVVGGAVGAVVCSPPYMIGRLGILMLGWHYLFWVGVALIVIGAALQTGVTSAVKAVKFSAKLVGDPTTRPAAGDGAATDDGAAATLA